MIVGREVLGRDDHDRHVARPAGPPELLQQLEEGGADDGVEQRQPRHRQHGDQGEQRQVNRAAGRERRTLEGSLRALGMDYVDLWLVHWPPRGRALVSTWKELRPSVTRGWPAPSGT